MKSKILLASILLLSSALCALSQIPQGFNYQAIARDGSGNPITGATIKVMLSVLSDTTGFYGGTGGTYIWEEEHTNVKTNSFGMFTVVLGSPTATKVQGTAASFSAIDWSPANLFIGTKIANPTTYKIMGSAKLWSVPYALRAKDSEQWQTSGDDIFRASGSVGIGTSPSYSLDVAGEVTSRNANAFRLRQSTFGTILRSDNADFWLLLTNSGDPDGTWNTLRPFRINLATGNTILGNGALTVNHGANVGVGTTAPNSRLHVRGNASTAALEGSNHTFMDFFPLGFSSGRRAWLGFGAANAPVFSITNLNTSDGHIALMPGTGANVGIGTTSPAGRLSIQTPATWDDNTPIFEVKNKLGVPILAVYNNGIRILVEDTDGKGVKGGFAIGGFDPTKAPGDETVNLMMISSDSVRFNIDNNPAKAVKGGFAIGSFDGSKAVNPKTFMNLTPTASASGQFNTFLGYQAGKDVTLGGYNVFLGYQAGPLFKSGSHNVFIGHKVGEAIIQSDANVLIGDRVGIRAGDISNNVIIGFLAGQGTGNWHNNVFIGYESGAKNTTTGSWNTFIGSRSGKSNTTGNNNVFIGVDAGWNQSDLAKISTGSSNVFIGDRAAASYTSASYNVVLGNEASARLTSGEFNTVLGYQAGQSKTTGSDNAFFGSRAGINVTTGNNNIAIGNNAQVPSATASNQIRLGNSSITYAGIQVAWTITSDKKLKDNISRLPVGLDFVNKLNPVYYTRNNHSEDKYESGFIAQDVEKIIEEFNLGNSGIISKGDDGTLELRYNDFIPILTRAIQEQQSHIESEKAKNTKLESELESLKERLSALEAMMGNR